MNCVAPDVIPTPGIGPMPVRTPLLRPGHVDDVAGVIVFLAGDHAGFITGSTVHVDGGNHAAGGWHRTEAGSSRPERARPTRPSPPDRPGRVHGPAQGERRRPVTASN